MNFPFKRNGKLPPPLLCSGAAVQGGNKLALPHAGVQPSHQDLHEAALKACTSMVGLMETATKSAGVESCNMEFHVQLSTPAEFKSFSGTRTTKVASDGKLFFLMEPKVDAVLGNFFIGNRKLF